MSRHHYSLFVHGEKLVFLMRREPGPGEDMEVFRPAEWRYHLPQINDGQWHYYALSADLPHVSHTHINDTVAFHQCQPNSCKFYTY